MRTRVLLVAMVALVAVAPAVHARATEGPSTWVVSFRADAAAGERAAAVAHVTVLDGQAGGDFVLVEAATRPSHPAIARVEALVPVSVAATNPPDDPAYPYQWHLPTVQAGEAWSTSTGQGVTVAVLDTGIAYEDYGAYRKAPDFATTAFAAGWDFVNADAHPNDDHGHGTHVAGTIAESTGNRAGGAGVAPGATLMPVKVLDDKGNGSDWAISQGLRWAADHGARVANLSIGGAAPSTVLADAVAYATAKGVTIVASTGNDGGAVAYPAAYPSVIAVGAIRIDGSRPGYSNHGAGIDLVAPGGDLGVDQNRDGYPDGILQQTFTDGVPDRWCMCFYQGTSMAAPHVSAVAALVLSASPVSTPAQVEAALVASARDLGPAGWDTASGHGLVQARAALLAVAPPEPAPAPVAAAPVAIDPDDPFLDDDGNAHEAAINQLAVAGLVNGLSPGVYGPSRGVTRAQMATFLARALTASGVALPPAVPDAFADDDGNVHETAVNQLAALGIVSGVGAGAYAPDAAVTRAQMATFLVRAVELAAGPTAVATATTDYFADDDGNVHEAAINVAAQLQLASGTSPGTYSPALVVRRDQMASFLVRTLALLA
jgi:subtilisin family serine protease